MKEKVEEAKLKIQNLWQETNKNKKIGFIVGIVVFLLVTTLLILKITTPKYTTLYSDLSLKDVSEVTKKLDELSIPWKSGKRENVILVQEDMSTKAKIELAAEGIPKEGYSFIDAFNDSSWTMTDFDKKQRMKQALQSELSKTISEIDGVKSAKVYIEENEKTNFVLNDESAKSTASVFIVKDTNDSLTNEKVIAIKNLVAGSASMDPENVIITDNQGRLLDGQNKDLTSPENQFVVKQNLETRINDSIRNFLANIYGYENVDVLSSVKINLDSEKRTEKIFSPPVEGTEEGIVRSTEQMEEDFLGQSPMGIPGERPNTEDYDFPEESRERQSRASKIINYEINEINREINKTPGQVEDITVAVLINEKSLPDGELTTQKSEEISNLIYAATGLDTKNVKVIAEQFNNNISETDSSQNKIQMNSSILIPIIILIVLVAIGVFVMLKRRKEEEERIELENRLNEELNEVEEEDLNILNFEQEESQMKKQIDKFIDEKPEDVAQLLRNWLKE